MQKRYSRISEKFKADLNAHLMISMQGPAANLPIFKDIILLIVTTIQNTGFKDNKIVSSKLVTCDNIAYVFLVASSNVVLNILV